MAADAGDGRPRRRGACDPQGSFRTIASSASLEQSHRGTQDSSGRPRRSRSSALLLSLLCSIARASL